MHPQPRIAIVGGGLAALTLGRVLQIKSIQFTIFERDSTSANRSQGGTLDLDTNGGQLALRIANLHDEFRKHMRLEGQAIRIANKKGEYLFQHLPDEGDETRPEIDRGHLRQIFIDVLGDNIKWNSHVKSISKIQPSGYQLSFADGSFQIFDLIIGADGCFSTVRQLVSSARPGYTGLTFHEMYLADADNNHPAEAATVGHGSIFTLGDGKGILAQRNTDGKIRVYAALSVPEYWSKQVDKEYDWNNPHSEARKKLLDNFFSDWCDEYRNLITNSSNDSGIWPRPIYYLPVDHRWPHTPGVTLIGDAAHVMSPFAGEGANLAMLDGAKLGEAISEGITNGRANALEESINKFEEWMFGRASLSAIESDRNMRECMKIDGAERFASLVSRIAERGNHLHNPSEKYAP